MWSPERTDRLPEVPTVRSSACIRRQYSTSWTRSSCRSMGDPLGCRSGSAGLPRDLHEHVVLAQRGQVAGGGAGVDDDAREPVQRQEPVQGAAGELRVVDEQVAARGDLHHRALHRDDLVLLVEGVAVAHSRRADERGVEAHGLHRVHAGGAQERVVLRVVVAAEGHHVHVAHLRQLDQRGEVVGGHREGASAGRWGSICSAVVESSSSTDIPGSRWRQACWAITRLASTLAFARNSTLDSKVPLGWAVAMPRALRSTPCRCSSSRSRWIVMTETPNVSASSWAETLPVLSTSSVMRAWRPSGPRVRGASGGVRGAPTSRSATARLLHRSVATGITARRSRSVKF